MTAAFVIVAIVALCCVLSIPNISGLSGVLIAATFVVAICVVLYCVIEIMQRAVKQTDQTLPRTTNLFEQEKQTINRRLAEIEKRKLEIGQVQNRLAAKTGEEWQNVRGRLHGAQQILNRQQAVYNTKLVEIELLRWQNKFSPAVEQFENLTFAGIEKNLSLIENERAHAEKLQNQLQENARNATAETQILSRRIEETAGALDKLHESLLGKQAALALRSVAPLEDAQSLLVENENSNEKARLLEVFNAKVALNDFSQSLAALEAEYKRLELDDKAAQKISRLLENKTNG